MLTKLYQELTQQKLFHDITQLTKNLVHNADRDKERIKCNVVLKKTLKKNGYKAYIHITITAISEIIKSLFPKSVYACKNILNFDHPFFEISCRCC